MEEVDVERKEGADFKAMVDVAAMEVVEAMATMQIDAEWQKLPPALRTQILQGPPNDPHHKRSKTRAGKGYGAGGHSVSSLSAQEVNVIRSIMASDRTNVGNNSESPCKT
eukprot:14473403-Ditylum_brightwellii.AAC.2